MVFVYGTVCLDRVLRVPFIPKPGGYVSVESEEWRLGGEAANTAFALQTWGAAFRFQGNFSPRDDGQEPGGEGKHLRALLKEKGLYDGPVHPQRPPVCDIYVTPDGERTMFGLGFGTMPAHLLDEWLDGVTLFSIDMNFGEFGRECVRRAAAQGIRCHLMDFVADDDPIPPGSIWQTSTDWKGSKSRPDQNLALVHRMAEQHEVTAILTDGPHGCYYATPGAEPRHRPPIVHPKVVDATGAGDTFRAGILYGSDRGWPLEKTLDFALVAASLKCQYPGATTRQATLEEIYRHLR